jgi:hypothetical protein
VITEGQVYTAILATIRAGLLSRAITDPIAVKQWYQPRTQGAPTGMAILFSNLANPRYGFLGRFDEWDRTAGVERHTEIQANEYRFQCTAQSPPLPPPAPLNSYTAGDLVRLAATILASDAGRMRLQTAGFGIERITQVRQPYFQDEKGQFEAVPSFDFTLAFNQVEVTQSPVVDKTALRVLRV